MSDRDYDKWRASHRSFFIYHKELFSRVISKNSFVNHRSDSEKHEWEQKMMLCMELPEALSRLGRFGHKSSFLVFYTAILKDVVIAQNQEEDVRLLTKDFHTLIIKYQPMVNIVIDNLLPFSGVSFDLRTDVIQQLLVNLLGKRNAIFMSYDFQRLFRNFFWKIAENEAKNILRSERSKQMPNTTPDDIVAGGGFDLSSPERRLVLQDAVCSFQSKLMTYLHLRHKLILCLKVHYHHYIYPDDIRRLFQNVPELPVNNYQVTSDLLNHTKESETGKLHRFELVRAFLNYADKSQTDAQSYWRWTNHEITKIIMYLNNKHLMELNHEVFGFLLDYYFEFGTDNIQKNIKEL